MTDRDTSDRPIIGGAGGNTSGTGGPDHSGPRESAGAGAAGSGAVEQDELQTQARSSTDDQASSGGTAGSPAISGRNSSEGNAPASIALDPGDPGGMGGVRVKSGNPQDRPPGGVSPIDPEESSQG